MVRLVNRELMQGFQNPWFSSLLALNFFTLYFTFASIMFSSLVRVATSEGYRSVMVGSISLGGKTLAPIISLDGPLFTSYSMRPRLGSFFRWPFKLDFYEIKLFLPPYILLGRATHFLFYHFAI
jgi:hypothetical protein